MINVSNEEKQYDFIVVGAGSAGSLLAAELSSSGAQVQVTESGIRYTSAAPGSPHPTAPAFIEAAREMGMPILDDLNGLIRRGAGYINMNITRDGARVSAACAFLHPALSRPNLTLLLNTHVMKLNFNGTRCVGVRLITDGRVTDIAAGKEVILATGAIHSPKLLMLAGIGEAKALRSLGIEVVENLPGVGENLQDHVVL